MAEFETTDGSNENEQTWSDLHPFQPTGLMAEIKEAVPVKQYTARGH